jgi:putative Holliday junction resolvase
MRILGLDLGAKRIGLAVSDADSGLALPCGILESRGRKRDLATLCEMIQEREVERAVVGLPIHMNGQQGREAQIAKDFASELSQAAGIPVDTLDERWTSLEAQRLVDLEDGPARGGKPGRGRGKQRAPGKKRKKRIDDLAATLSLRTYLERRHSADRSGA